MRVNPTSQNQRSILVLVDARVAVLAIVLALVMVATAVVAMMATLSGEVRWLHNGQQLELGNLTPLIPHPSNGKKDRQCNSIAVRTPPLILALFRTIRVAGTDVCRRQGDFRWGFPRG